jgi:hypothetical protein
MDGCANYILRGDGETGGGRRGGGKCKVAHLKHRNVCRALRSALRHVLPAARAALAARAARARVQRAERGGVVPVRSRAR